MSQILITEKQLKKLSDILLREQRITKEKLPVIDFTNTLKDNMIGVDDAALEAKLVEVENVIKKAEDEGQKLESIAIDITAGASRVPATNRLPQGKSRPDHTYRKIVPVDKWTTYNQMNELGTLKKEGDLPADYDPNTGYYEIEKGNTFLSRNRATRLSKKLKKYFTDHYPEITPQFKIKLKLEGDKKFATAKITGVTYKKETPPPTIPYIQFVNAPKGYEKSRYHMWDKEGTYGHLTPTTYEEIKDTMYKTPDEGGYTKDDQFFRVREKVDMTWEDFIKNRRRIKAGKGTAPEYNKLKPIPERQKEKKV